MSYDFKTKPFKHQADELEQFGCLPSRGRFWEQGTGKTKPTIDELDALFDAKEVDALCVIAPNGVHRNWVSDEIPTHMCDRIRERMRSHIWYSTGAKYHRDSFNRTLKHDGLAVLVMSYNAILTDRGRDAWKAFLKQRRCLYVLDESHRIKSPKAKWSKRLLGSNVAAPYRRVLTGTPVTKWPFDVYNQLRFLQPDIWKRLGLSSFSEFKQYFGIWVTQETKDGRHYPQCVSFKSLDILKQVVNEISSRVLKDEVLDLPPKLYSKRYVQLTPQQRRLYRELADDFMLDLATGMLTANLAIVRLLRFQQVICGYLPVSDDDRTLVDIPGGNPRLELLVETCESLGHKAIIWARFKRDIRNIQDHKFFRDKCVVVDGSVTGEARGQALDAFQKGDAEFLIANPAAIATGVTLTAAKTVIYYSNSFDLELRLQSEDRAHRIGQSNQVEYIDLVAEDTVDMQIVDSLRKKINVACEVTGDTIKDWI